MRLNALLGRLGTILGLRLFPMWVGDAIMSVFMAMTWVEPTRFGQGVPGDLLPILAFEALAMHSTPFVWVVRTGKLPPWILLVYVPFGLAVASVIDAPILIALFFWHLASALWTDRRSEGDLNAAMLRYAIVAMVFILLFFVLAVVPMPELGWRAGNVSSDFALTLESGEHVYQTVPAYLTIYFTFRAVWHILWWHWERTGVVAKMGQASRA